MQAEAAVALRQGLENFEAGSHNFLADAVTRDGCDLEFTHEKSPWTRIEVYFQSTFQGPDKPFDQFKAGIINGCWRRKIIAAVSGITAISGCVHSSS